MIPSDRTRSTNPFNYLLNAALRELGCSIDQSGSILSVKRADIVNLHWPHHFANSRSIAVALRRSLSLLVGCSYHKMRGAKIVWTAHNFENLDAVNPRLERLLMQWFETQVDGIIFLSQYSQSLLSSFYPQLTSKPAKVVPHGLYGSIYPGLRDRAPARRQWDIDSSAVVIGLLGDIKPYKGTEIILETAARLGERSPHILLAGECQDSLYEVGLRELVERARAAGVGVTYKACRLTDDELACMIDSVDAVCLPYLRSLNSGLAILALERNCRLITSAEPSFVALRDEVGSYWVTPIGEEGYEDVMRLFRPRPPSEDEQHSLKLFKDRRSWANLSALTLDFYTHLQPNS